MAELAALCLFVGAAQAEGPEVLEAIPGTVQEYEQHSAQHFFYTPQYEDQIVQDYRPYQGCKCPTEYCPCKAPEPQPRCPVGVTERQEPPVRCVPTRYTDELEVQVYEKPPSTPEESPIVELIKGRRRPTPHVVNGQIIDRPWVIEGSRTQWGVLPSTLYTIYAWQEPSGHKCLSRTVKTGPKASFIHAGMGCG
jgi:hypothetical protein